MLGERPTPSTVSYRYKRLEKLVEALELKQIPSEKLLDSLKKADVPAQTVAVAPAEVMALPTNCFSLT